MRIRGFKIISEQLLNLRSDYRIDNCDPTVEGEFSNLSGRQLSIGVAELHRRGILDPIRIVPSRTNTVVSGLLDLVVSGQTWILQMDRLGINQIRRPFGCIFLQEKLTSLILIAPPIIDRFRIADVFLLL